MKVVFTLAKYQQVRIPQKEKEKAQKSDQTLVESAKIIKRFRPKIRITK